MRDIYLMVGGKVKGKTRELRKGREEKKENDDVKIISRLS